MPDDEKTSQNDEPWTDTWGFLSDEQIERRQRRISSQVEKARLSAETLTGVEKEVWRLLWCFGEEGSPPRESVACQLAITPEELDKIEREMLRRLYEISKGA